MCVTTVLSRHAQTVIGYCKCCSSLYLWHNNLMLCFDIEQFKAFRNFPENCDYEDMVHDFPDGSERIILRTPNRDINFTFTLDEWEDMKQAMDEALYMREVYALL